MYSDPVEYPPWFGVLVNGLRSVEVLGMSLGSKSSREMLIVWLPGIKKWG